MFSWRNKKDISLFRMKKKTPISCYAFFQLYMSRVKQKRALEHVPNARISQPFVLHSYIHPFSAYARMYIFAWRVPYNKTIFHYLLVFVFKPKNSDYRSLLCYLLIIILPCICLTQFRLNRLPSPHTIYLKSRFSILLMSGYLI